MTITLSAVRSDHCWSELLGAAGRGLPRPALFLDRDGVVVEEREYLSRIEDLAVVPGAAEAIAGANRAGWPVVLVTNQSGIARGYFDWQAFAAVQSELVERLRRRGAVLDMVLGCPFHPDGAPPYRHPDHPWRKPNPGMLIEAARHLGIDLESSWLVGDKRDDLLAARAAGLRHAAHVMTGHGVTERRKLDARPIAGLTVRRWNSIAEAVGLWTE